MYTNSTDKISVIEKRASLSGLTLKSDMLVSFETDRWRTTLKSDIATTKVDVGRQH